MRQWLPGAGGGQGLLRGMWLLLGAGNVPKSGGGDGGTILWMYYVP